MIWIAGNGRDRGSGRCRASADVEPVRPTRRNVPPRAVDPLVGADRKDVEMLGIAGDRANRRARCRRTATDLEPTWSPHLKMMVKVPVARILWSVGKPVCTYFDVFALWSR